MVPFTVSEWYCYLLKIIQVIGIYMPPSYRQSHHHCLFTYYSLCLNPYGLLSGMDVHITGLGPLSGLRAPVCAWARGAGLAHAAPLLATQLQRELHIALAELPLWDLMHGKH